jgi:hypothetical protein
MLAFTDEGLARLVIAASAIPPSRRAVWLQRLAVRIEKSSPRARTRGAIYTAQWRAREKAGRCLLKLEVDEAVLAVALVDAGLLNPNIADDRAALTAAAQQALVQFCDGEASRHDARICDSLRSELALTALQKAPPRAPKKR